ncbi:cupin domain-containing protein [Sphingomonas montanisoli]|uniref:Cupin domain-containing protein n=1 Tax=Sphingomonas montanisoli TaxID=2606412 RepID=A0A5D9C4K7_9SPHN|nr:hypothetical protein [Sphingomonas montanisoli]TZG24895.1 hypothetical protein FYJ91_16580 [Sphingomonas montanisoli]
MDYASLSDMQAWARAKMQRPRDFAIGPADNPYLLRWWIMPRNEGCNLYLHQILRDDDDRALHDHPWENTSYLIEGAYREITPDGILIRQAGDVVTRSATALHRLELIGGKPCVSIFMTGPKVREWGFDCGERGWVHWRDFTAGDNGELVGRGCGEHEPAPKALA